MKTLSEKRTNNNKENTRIKKTESLIKTTFIELVQKYGYSNVSIKDIITKAQINRNTFYLHYANKEDLVEKIIYGVLTSQNDLIKDHFNSIFTIEQTEKNYYIILKNILTILSKEITFYKIIFLDKSISGYLHNSLRTLILDSLHRNHQHHQNLLNIFDEFMVDGMLGVVREWIINENYTVDELAIVLSKLIVQADKINKL